MINSAFTISNSRAALNDSGCTVNGAGMAIDEKISSGKFIEGEDYAPVQERGPKPQNPKPKTQNPKPKTQNPKPKTQNPKPKTQNPEPKPRATNRKPQTCEDRVQDEPASDPSYPDSIGPRRACPKLGPDKPPNPNKKGQRNLIHKCSSIQVLVWSICVVILLPKSN